jgi:hypothetical protein
VSHNSLDRTDFVLCLAGMGQGMRVEFMERLHVQAEMRDQESLRVSRRAADLSTVGKTILTTDGVGEDE